MTVGEFVKIDPKEIRRDKELMQLFIIFYEAAFSFLPKCVGCSFNKGFKKLKRYIETGKKNINFDKNTIEMNAKTFVLKKEYLTKILTFLKDGKTHRKYGYQLTEDFAKQLVEHGKGDLFSTLPEQGKEPIAIVEPEHMDLPIKEYLDESIYDSMDYRKEILPLYAEVKERTGKEADSRKQSDIIKFLQDNEG